MELFWYLLIFAVVKNYNCEYFEWDYEISSENKARFRRNFYFFLFSTEL